MPKQIPEAIKLRIAAMVGANATGPAIIAVVAAEFDGYRVSDATVSRLRSQLNLSKRAGRPKGIPNPQEPTSPLRQLAREMRAQRPRPTLAEIGSALGISPERVRQFLSDGK